MVDKDYNLFGESNIPVFLPDKRNRLELILNNLREKQIQFYFEKNIENRTDINYDDEILDFIDESVIPYFHKKGYFGLETQLFMGLPELVYNVQCHSKEEGLFKIVVLPKLVISSIKGGDYFKDSKIKKQFEDKNIPEINSYESENNISGKGQGNQMICSMSDWIYVDTAKGELNLGYFIDKRYLGSFKI
ncbi:MAG TPA: hypothetical protein VJB35_00925 [Candidatus Nanoarchaeia archaeon]|nr:hypothetical protein [Candidatus Nanoarchaeia archaeon]